MKPNELFTHIWNSKYNKSGFDLDWKVEIDDEERKVRLMFQPSASVKDWIVNIGGFLPIFKFPLFYTMGWKVVLDGCKAIIMEEVIRNYNQHPNYKVEICGHSYGGAMSIDFGVELFRKTKIKADIVTFGAPRPLFSIYSMFIAKLCLGNVVQYAHWSDCVTYCPPLIGYYNVKVKRIGNFSLKGLLNPNVYHMIYDQENLYDEV